MPVDPNKEKQEEKEKEEDWNLGKPQNACNLNKKPDDECESCQ